jgi:protein-L-isoaspartate(D-aspartate) O-methyltransferase
MPQQFDYALARRLMVERQLAGRGLRNQAVLKAMSEVPRERFVPEALQENAYADSPLPIGARQTISQPFVVAMMIDAAGIGPQDRVLEVGAGSGYAAAVMSRLAAQVFAIERHGELASAAATRLAELGYDNVELRAGDGTTGWAEHAPFDAIVVSASGPAAPQSLKDQLRIGGHLVMPVGRTSDQRLMKLTRRSATEFGEQDLGGVAFVPLVGVNAWQEE